MLKLIWAEDSKGNIGNGNKLPWHIKTDLEHFKKTTLGHSIVMGRKTFESLGNKPLPYRDNFVLTTDNELIKNEHEFDNVTYTARFKALLEMAKTEDIFVIGGKSVYDLFMPYADEIYRTVIQKTYEGDTQAPVFNKREWHKDSSIEVKKPREPKLIFEHYKKLDII